MTPETCSFWACIILQVLPLPQSSHKSLWLPSRSYIRYGREMEGCSVIVRKLGSINDNTRGRVWGKFSRSSAFHLVWPLVWPDPWRSTGLPDVPRLSWHLYLRDWLREEWTTQVTALGGHFGSLGLLVRGQLTEDVLFSGVAKLSGSWRKRSTKRAQPSHVHTF